MKESYFIMITNLDLGKTPFIHNIVCIKIDHVLQALERVRQALRYLLHFSKAPTTVDHEIIFQTALLYNDIYNTRTDTIS